MYEGSCISSAALFCKVFLHLAIIQKFTMKVRYASNLPAHTGFIILLAPMDGQAQHTPLAGLSPLLTKLRWDLCLADGIKQL